MSSSGCRVPGLYKTEVDIVFLGKKKSDEIRHFLNKINEK
jgi:hypothetical protein